MVSTHGSVAPLAKMELPFSRLFEGNRKKVTLQIFFWDEFSRDWNFSWLILFALKQRQLLIWGRCWGVPGALELKVKSIIWPHSEKIFHSVLFGQGKHMVLQLTSATFTLAHLRYGYKSISRWRLVSKNLDWCLTQRNGSHVVCVVGAEKWKFWLKSHWRCSWCREASFWDVGLKAEVNELTCTTVVSTQCGQKHADTPWHGGGKGHIILLVFGHTWTKDP